MAGLPWVTRTNRQSTGSIDYIRRMPIPARILLVLAHPDDESFVAAGLARRYVERGAEVALVTATRGDAGRVGDPPLCDREALPALREAELREAADLLGIADVHLLDYQDKRLSEAPTDRIRAELVALIRRHRPHLVITFDPNGMNGHTDHVAISRFTMDAVAAAADPRWVTDTTPHQVQRLLWTAPILPWEVTRPADLRLEPGVDFAIDIAPYRHAKAEALRAHRSQHVPVDRCFLSKPDVDRILSIETFRQAWGPPLPRVPADDVLAGIDLSE